jgi:hypothetical protein
MSVKEHLYLLLLIFKQEKLFGRAREGNLGSRRIFLSVLAGHKKKLLAGRYLPTPGIKYQNARWQLNLKKERTSGRIFRKTAELEIEKRTVGS